MDLRPRCTSKAGLRAALVALKPSLDKLLPPEPEPLPVPSGKPSSSLSAPGRGLAEVFPSSSADHSSLEIRNSLFSVPNSTVQPFNGSTDPNPDWLVLAHQIRVQQYEISQQLIAAGQRRLR